MAAAPTRLPRGVIHSTLHYVHQRFLALTSSHAIWSLSVWLPCRAATPCGSGGFTSCFPSLSVARSLSRYWWRVLAALSPLSNIHDPLFSLFPLPVSSLAAVDAFLVCRSATIPRLLFLFLRALAPLNPRKALAASRPPGAPDGRTSNIIYVRTPSQMLRRTWPPSPSPPVRFTIQSSTRLSRALVTYARKVIFFCFICFHFRKHKPPNKMQNIMMVNYEEP